MQGILIDSKNSIGEILQPIISEIDELYWLLDLQSGPFRSEWLAASPENEQKVAAKLITISANQNISTQVWRPGFISELADHLIIGEWSYFTGFIAPETAVAEIVIEFFNSDFLTAEYFQLVEAKAEIFLVYVDGWWEIYTPRSDWQQKFLNHSSAQLIDGNKWHR